jgi:hypothetical protein
MLVGTEITKKDIVGTFVVIFSVIWIVIFGGMNAGQNGKKILLILKKVIFEIYIFFLSFRRKSHFGKVKITYDAPTFHCILFLS